MARRAILLLTLVLLAAGCAGPRPDGAHDGLDDVPVPDPLVAGPRTVTELEYDFGLFVVDDSSVPLHYTVPLHGSIHLPEGDAAAPLILLLHGRHSTCDYAGQLEFLAAACADAPPAMEPVDSYTGYDGLAANLASWGYAVASIDANTINDRDLAGDSGANARAAVVLRTLDEFASVNATGEGLGTTGIAGAPLDLPANAPASDMSAAQGRLDLTRVGLMGHSRGGEGVARAISLDDERNGGAHGIDAVFALAPTDFARWLVPHVAFATLLPYCDGDVSNLQGSWMYDDARRLDPAAPRHQVLAMGANHNFYNTVWTGDDWGTTGAWCGSDEKDSGRDDPEQQRAHGYGLMAAFFRLYVGGETVFGPMWDGAGSTFPASLCPDRPSCDGRLHASLMSTPRIDLSVDGMLPGQADITTEGCDPGTCPSQPTYAGARMAAWKCAAPGAGVTFARGDLQDWRAFSLRVGGTNVTTFQLWLEVQLPGEDHRSADAVFPARPGDDDTGKTVLSEVRFPLTEVAGIEQATGVRLRCQGAGTLQVADVMLV